MSRREAVAAVRKLAKSLPADLFEVRLALHGCEGTSEALEFAEFAEDTMAQLVSDLGQILYDLGEKREASRPKRALDPVHAFKVARILKASGVEPSVHGGPIVDVLNVGGRTFAWRPDGTVFEASKSFGPTGFEWREVK